MKINCNYLNLEESYLFSTVARKVREYKSNHPEAKVISLGIGDVTKPLCQAVVDSLIKASKEMGCEESFKGYGPEQGYAFLREAIREDYKKNKVTLDADEIFVSDGAKSDIGNILNLFDTSNTVLIPNPVYPVYVDTNIMDGRKILFMDANEANNFLPMPDYDTAADIIYLCSPNNPTGAVYNREQLTKWVEYARSKNALILFDAAYEAFIDDEYYPKSIYEIENARCCAIEFRSLSKTAGFTGTRCGYTVVPEELVFDSTSLNKLWLRRQTTKFNGVPYVVQRGAEAVFSKDGQEQIKANIGYYKENARIISETLTKLGIWHIGGKESPYIWMKCPKGMDSWTYFDYLLENYNIVGTPGCGFGKNGEGYFRLTAFGSRKNTIEAQNRLMSK